MPETRAALLDFVAAEHPPFSPYYASPRAGTAVCAIMRGELLVGAVLLETAPLAPSPRAMAPSRAS